MYSVFGSSGFIGSNFCQSNLNNCIQIARESRVPKSNKIIYFISTIDNYNIFDSLHLDIDTNLKILMEVLDNCKDKSYELNFISSWFVYGSTDNPAKETDNCNPKGFYSITKLAAEQLLTSFCETFGVKYRILRLSNVYGKGDSKVSSKKNAIQYMIKKLKKNEDIELYEGGDVYRDLMHVSDVCRAINLVLEKGKINEIYNIGSGHSVSIKNIMNMAHSYLSSKSNMEKIPTPEFHKIVQCKNFYMNNSKLMNLGFKQEISIERGIEQMCEIL